MEIEDLKFTNEPKPTRANLKRTVELAQQFMEEYKNAFQEIMEISEKNGTHVQFPTGDSKTPEWNRTILKEDPSTWPLALISVNERCEPHVYFAPDGLDGKYVWARFDSSSFWLVDKHGELVEPSKGATFTLDKSNGKMGVNPAWSDKFPDVFPYIPQAISNDAEMPLRKMFTVTHGLSPEEDDSTLWLLSTELIRVRAGDPWFEVENTVIPELFKCTNPNRVSFMFKDAVDKAIRETIGLAED